MRNGNSQVMFAKAHIPVDTIDTGDNYCETTIVTSMHDSNNRSVSHTAYTACITALFLIYSF